MNETIDRMKDEFRRAITAERHGEAERVSTALLDILAVSYRSDVRQWEQALELWHWAQRTARAQRSHLAREQEASQPVAAYGSRRFRMTSTFIVEG
ncbi:hypothetical protein [uncultured Paludibaculum sp.]|uniref:hypothetical protein n=1 Tax=uncultured Paludibaculum sp. TaxID=1765020 RepID=UPI002AABA1ED|nr:hypothetical protein [uncultured Paludibaculum sp.]